MNRQIIVFAAAVFFLNGIEAAAQEQVQEKPDLSNPDAISQPPMDPYSLSYIPERPSTAKDIKTPEACDALGGKWQSRPVTVNLNSAAEEITTVNMRIVGCTLNGKAQGRWMYAVDYGSNNKYYHDLDEKHALGYVWMIDDKKFGWEAVLNQPEDFVRLLTPYQNGILSGTSFAWNEMGALSEVITYNELGERHGKYEKYVNCLPTALGQYENGKPSGKWDIFEEPGMISVRRYFDRKAQPSELPKDLSEATDAYWTEWFNPEGVKLSEGYSLSDTPTSPGTKIGKIQLYTSVGVEWISIQYNGKGYIDDAVTFNLCSLRGRKEKPDYIDYSHDDVYINCKDSENEIYLRIYYYKFGKVWKIIPYKDGIPDGKVTEYHPSKTDALFGPILSEYQVVSGTPEGKIIYLDESGEPFDEGCEISMGTGHFKSWWYNGKVSEEGDYYHRDKHGTWTKYYDTGAPEYETTFKNGYKTGVQKQWFSNGVLAGEISYLGGSRDGDVNWYYADGRIAVKSEYKTDVPSGVWYSYTHGGKISKKTNYNTDDAMQNVYYSDGKIQASGVVLSSMMGDMKDGHWNYYLKNGKQWYSAEYVSDEVVSSASTQCSAINGEYKIDAENREVGCTVCAVNRAMPLQKLNMRENEWKWFSDTGALEKKGSIHLGHLNNDWEYYYPTGKPMLSGRYLIDRKIGKWTGYYESGSKKFSGNYDNGIETGIWMTYHDKTESVSSQGEFIDGKRHGEWKWFHANGQVREIGTFIHGKETGTWTTYYANGQKKGEGEFVEGLREGKWTWWRENGNEWRTANYVKGKEKNDKQAH